MATHEDNADVLRRRLARERRARREAEEIAERATAELYASVAKLQSLNAEIEETNRALREFVAIVSHDLGSPLTSVQGFADLLLQELDPADERSRSSVEAIRRQGEVMHRLVKDLLILSSIEIGVLEPKPADLSVVTELERAVAELPGEEGRRIEIEASPTLVVRADPDHLHRILTNYLTNALKYGEDPIEAEAGIHGDFVEVRVRDHGPGVPQVFRERLFSKFTRADTDATLRRTGTGLGLSIVRGLAEANGGEAWYEPAIPTGSCFGVRLRGRVGRPVPGVGEPNLGVGPG